MRYVYGPLKSRRLGLSLGVSLSPNKICDFDCIYCQLGRTPKLSRERKEYGDIKEIIVELKMWLQENSSEAVNIDYIAISGAGEPTLHSRLGELLGEIKMISSAKIAVITNASQLSDEGVRLSLSYADLVVPSLDTVIPEIFSKINRPVEGTKIEDITNGLIELRKEFRGKIWLEAMIVKGLNDSLSQIRKLKEIADKINPDKIQLNSPVRATAEKGIVPADSKKLEKMQGILGQKCEII